MKETAVLRAQRKRLKTAMVAATAELGYAEVTIAEIVRRARVSRQAFYAQFDSKEECYLSTADSGVRYLINRMSAAVLSNGHSDGSLTSFLRTTVRSYLQACREEPEFTRFLVVESLAAGLKIAEQRNEVMMTLARQIAAAHRAARPDAPPYSELTYLGAVGAMSELVYRYALAHKIDRIGELEKPFLELLEGLLTR
ncbi:MAG TPA: TetR/AcrR family transcriptional regulator [Polyangiales bacterium]|nr:TetR/AcrR family transcriptional regulator [Polyangiales bacterium]